VAARVTFSKKGEATGVSSMEGLHLLLLSLTVHDREGKRLKKDELRTWPASAIEFLFDKAQELCALGELGVASAGNE
jgi:hypothetical protein